MNILWNRLILVVVCFNVHLTLAVSSCHCVCHFADLALILRRSSVTLQQNPDDIPLGPRRSSVLTILFATGCSDPSHAVGISFWELVCLWLSHNRQQYMLVLVTQPSPASLVAWMVKNLPATQELQVWSLSWEDPLEKGMATDSSILAWRIPWTEEPGGLWSMGLQRVKHDWATNTRFKYMLGDYKWQNTLLNVASSCSLSLTHTIL